MEYEMEMESLHIGFESESPSGTAALRGGTQEWHRSSATTQSAVPPKAGAGAASARNDARATFIGLSNALRAATKREACRDLVCDNKMMMIIMHKISSLWHRNSICELLPCSEKLRSSI